MIPRLDRWFSRQLEKPQRIACGVCTLSYQHACSDRRPRGMRCVKTFPSVIQRLPRPWIVHNAIGYSPFPSLCRISSSLALTTGSSAGPYFSSSQHSQSAFCMTKQERSFRPSCEKQRSADFQDDCHLQRRSAITLQQFRHSYRCRDRTAFYLGVFQM